MHPARAVRATRVVFEDPFGERRPRVDPSGVESVEILNLRRELTEVPSFEFAVRERVSRFASFQNACYDKVCSVERASTGAAGETGAGAPLTLVSERTPGVRLVEILEWTEGQQEVALDIDTALNFTRQLVSAVAQLHEHEPDLSHGAIAPERIVVTPAARVIIVEHVFGSALEQLRFPQERLWRELRIPVPHIIGRLRFDQRTDVAQVGLVALALVLGRRLRDDEYPSRVGELVASAWAHSASGGFEPLPNGLRAWLRCALQLDPHASFPSALDARTELERMLAVRPLAPLALETFLFTFHASRATGPQRPAPVARAPVAPTAVLPAPTPPSVAPAPVLPTAAVRAVPAPIVESPPRTAAPDTSLDTGTDDADREREEVTMPATSRRRWRVAAVAVATIATLSGGAVAARRLLRPAAPVVQTGTLVVDSNPTGAQASVDGEPRGMTPVTVTLAPGTHTLELTHGGAPRTLQVIVPPGGHVAQYLELPKDAPSTGQLQVRSDPPGAQVVVDGQARGVSPLVLEALTPGSHVVTLENALGSVRQQVNVEAGATASLFVPLTSAQAGPASGWISVTTPVTMQLYENGRLLGSSDSDRIMVAAGKHEIEISSQALAFRTARTVQVAPGKVSPIALELPKQRIALNAIPWAEVWIDGERVGETPIGDASVSVGTHDVVFRHPELGERRQSITVTAATSSRVSVDLRQK